MSVTGRSALPAKPPRHCRCGFAIITMVAMIALVAACLVVLAEVFSYQIKLTNTTIARLQVDLLLNAGAHCAIADLDAGNVPAKPLKIGLPVALGKRGGQLSISALRHGESKIIFTLRAAFANMRSQRLLTFQRSATHWRLTTVTIPGSSFGMKSFQQHRAL